MSSAPDLNLRVTVINPFTHVPSSSRLLKKSRFALLTLLGCMLHPFRTAVVLSLYKWQNVFLVIPTVFDRVISVYPFPDVAAKETFIALHDPSSASIAFLPYQSFRTH